MRNAVRFLLLVIGSFAISALSLRNPGPAVAQDAPSIRRHALLVGCTTYPSLVVSAQLSGPANDVQLMRTLLIERFHFSGEQIKVLAEDVENKDDRPTRANIHREFRGLADRVQVGDQVVILMAGHGSQQPDDDPDNPEDWEPDGYDEIFLPTDIGEWDGSKQRVENAISDDEIRGWLTDIRSKGAFVWIVIDACHSGTMIRGAGEEVLRQVPADALVPKAALEQAARRAAERGERRRGFPGRSGSMDLANGTGGIVALYAAQSSEPTIEKPMPPDGEQRKRYGLLTYTINQVLIQAQSPLTYRELAQRVHAQYTRWQRTFPTPMLEGTHVDREVLGQKDWQGRSRILLSRATAGTYTVNAGSLSGLTKGSILEVFPPAGEANADKPLGHVRLSRVQPLRSLVSPIAFEKQPANNDLPSGARCRAKFQDYGDYRLRVGVDHLNVDGEPVSKPQLESLGKLLAKLAARKGSFIKTSTSESPADWLLRVGGDNVYLVPAAGWKVAGGPAASGGPSPQFGPAPIDQDLPAWLEERFCRIARVHNLLRLDADNPASVLRAGSGVDVRVELLRYASQTARDFEVVEWDNGRTVNEKDIVQFRVKNNGRQPVDVTLLFVDSEYGITAYFPSPGGLDDNRIAPGKTFLTPRAEVTPTDLPEHMVVIAVRAEPLSERVDFALLEQPSLERVRTRGGDGSLASPFGQLLKTNLFATGKTRGLQTETVDNYAVRRITWNVERRED